MRNGLNKLSLNIEKAVFITFGNDFDIVPTNVQNEIKDMFLYRVERDESLRVFFEYNIKWDKQIKYVIFK